MNKNFLNTLILCCCTIFLFGQRGNDNMGPGQYGAMPSGPGKCYAKCLDVTNKVDTSFFVYYVLAEEAEPLKGKLNSITHELDPIKGNWIKAFKNSEIYPIWEMTEVSDVIPSIEYLSDRKIRNIDSNKIDTIYVEIENDFILVPWMEVLCTAKRTTEILIEIENELIRLAYLEPLEETSPVDITSLYNGGRLNKAMNQYQEDHNLCKGQLTIETLQDLGLIE